VIDFGVAKSLQGRLTKETLATLQDMLIGTPLYMSPEQLEQNSSDVNERSDIYSLGIILYELVAGTTPLPHKTPTAMTLADMRQALHDQDLPRPSKRFQTLGKKTTVIAKRRGIKPPVLERLLRGDLDWVVMKAIEKECERRYSDVIALSEDLDRYLSNKPVSAGPPSLAYRTRKFIRRHKTTRSVFAAVIITVLLGACIMTFSYFQLTKKPASLIEERGWKLEKFYDMGKVGANAFALRPDGSVLLVAEWGPMPKGLYWAKKGGTWSEADSFSISKDFTDPEDAVELPEGIYVTVNSPRGFRGSVLKIPVEGGKPEIFCKQPIINPFAILIAPAGFQGANVNPGDLVVLDNALGHHDKTTIWTINRTTGAVHPLVVGNPLKERFLLGSFAPDGTLYASLNTHKKGGVSILRISPNGNMEVVLRYFYITEGKNQGSGNIAVHPNTGEVFFSAQQEIFAFLPGKTTPRRVLSRSIDAMRWAPDGSKLYFIADRGIWTLSGPGIESQPVSTGKHKHALPEQTANPALKTESKPAPQTTLDFNASAEQMVSAAIRGDIVKAADLLKTHPSLLNATAGNGYQSTPLHFAAYNGRSDFAEWLLSLGANASAVNRYGVMPLHDAAGQGHKRIVELLLTRNPPVNAKDDKGKTPLQYALENGHTEVVGILRTLPQSATTEINGQEPELSIWLECADSNGDGKLSMAEYLSEGKRSAERKVSHFDSKTWMQYFSYMDVNDDSFVTSDEDARPAPGSQQSGSGAKLIGTWHLVDAESEPPPGDPPLAAMRLALTPQNRAFAIMHYKDRTHEIWRSSYRIEGNRFYEDFYSEQVWQYRFENGLLVMKSDKDQLTFEAVK